MTEKTPQPDSSSDGTQPFPTVSYHDGSDPEMPTLLDRSDAKSSSSESASLSLVLPLRLGRFHLENEIARGGMGAVLRGRDETFDRPLAFKVILDKYCNNAQALRRFHNEAQITGQLQHPGIPPVHEQGKLPDGRPFFSMKLIEGRSLDQILGERQSADTELPHLIAIFEQVCQTVAYAHSRHILHRDLKPNNIMVGEFGEVQVMDWGLGKRLHGEGEEGVTVEVEPTTPGEEHDGKTRAGTILGTPAYLAPEQARGEIDRLDERCDVFGLGAILSEILTGKPPYTGSATRNIHEQAALGDLDQAIGRLGTSGADTELIQLTTRCLSLKPDDRPRNAKEVAEAIASYQRSVQERLQQATIDSAQAQTKANEERKRRKLSLALSSAILLFLLGLAGVGFWLQHTKAEEQQRQALLAEQQRNEVKATVQQTRDLIEKTRWSQARFLLRRTQERLQDASEDLRDRLTRSDRDVALAEKLFHLRFERSLSAKSIGARPTADSHYEQVFQEADLYLFADSNPGTVAEKIRKSSLRKHWIAALDEWAMAAKTGSRHLRILEVAKLADGDAFRNRFRDAELLADPPELRRQLNEVDGDKLPPEMWAILCLRIQGFDRHHPPLPLFRKAQEAYPTDYALNYLTGNALYGPSPQEAVGFYRAALAVRPDSFGVLLNLGSILSEIGNKDESFRMYQRAAAIKPDSPAVHMNLGVQMREVKKYEQAIEHFEKVLSVHPKAAPAHAELGWVWYEQQAFLKASESFAKAFEVDFGALKDPTTRHRDTAARSAVLAAASAEKGAEPLSLSEQSQWRNRALGWLRADLDLWTTLAEQASNDPKRKAILADWLTTDEFASVRDTSALEHLPREQREAWQRLWDEVQTLQQK